MERFLASPPALGEDKVLAFSPLRLQFRTGMSVRPCYKRWPNVGGPRGRSNPGLLLPQAAVFPFSGGGPVFFLSPGCGAGLRAFERGWAEVALPLRLQPLPLP